MTLVGPIGRWVADATGIGTGPLQLWTWIKWPLLIALSLLLFSLLYKFTPSRRQPPLWWLLPGAVAGVALWLVASAGFSFYLDNFASYNRVYGTLGALVAFLVWAWLVNLALLLGVEVNRDVELRRAGEPGSGRRPRVPRRPRTRERIIGVHANRPAPSARRRPTSGDPMPDFAALQQELRRLAAERDVVILAHNYQRPEVQDVADSHRRLSRALAHRRQGPAPA